MVKVGSTVLGVGDALVGWTKVQFHSPTRWYDLFVSPVGVTFRSRAAALRSIGVVKGGGKPPRKPREPRGPQEDATAKPRVKKRATITGRRERNRWRPDNAHTPSDPQRVYAGVSVPQAMRVPAGEDLPGWEIERVEAESGQMYLMYFDPEGVAVGSRGFALEKAGLLKPTPTDGQLRRHIEFEKLELMRLMKTPVSISPSLADQMADEEPSVRWSEGEYDTLLSTLFSPGSMQARRSDIEAGDIRRKVAVIDLYCGAGGLSLGFTANGFDVFGVDYCRAARATYKENGCGLRSLEQRLRRADVEEWASALTNAKLAGPEADVYLVLIGSPPCLPYTQHGAQRGASDERDGVEFIVELARRVKPLFVIIENVPAMMHPKFSETVQPQLALLGDEYKVKARIHACSNHGIAQKRKRLLITAARVGDVDASVPESTELRVGHVVGERSVFPGDVLHDSALWTGECPAHLRLNLSCARARLRINTPTNTQSLVGANVLAPTVCTSSFKNATYNRFVVVPTDVDPYKATYGDLRMLCREHGLRLQSFPPHFKLFGNQNVTADQIGNAVPPLLAYDIASALHVALIQAQQAGRLAQYTGRVTSQHFAALKTEVYRRISV